MKKLVKILLFIPLLGCKGVYSQNTFAYKNVPDAIKSKNLVSDDVRAKTIAGISDLYDLTKSLPANYVKDGSVDYTDYLQKGIDANQDVIFPNFPILVNSKGLSLKSNSNVVFAKNSKLILKPTETDNYQIIRMYGIKNTKLYYPNIIGDRNGHLGKGGEFGMGISIRNATDDEVYNANVSNCWGDGIFFDDLAKNITLYSPFLDNNRRNGISIVWANGIKIYNMLSSNTNGTSPMSGIDIEPDHNNQLVDNILLQSPVTYNNSNRGILIALKNYAGPAAKNINIDIIDHQDIGSNYGVGFYLGNKKVGSAAITGNIRVVNPNYRASRKSPIFMDSEMSDNNINLNISNPKVEGKLPQNLKKMAEGTRNVQFN